MKQSYVCSFHMSFGVCDRYANRDSSELWLPLIVNETLGDPVPPRAKVTPRTLERWTVNSKAWYVDNCGRNAKALHGMMGLLPKEKIDLYAGWKSKVALFPRSEQYEYSHIGKMGIKVSRDRGEEDPPKLTKEETDETSGPAAAAAFEYRKSPVWWQDEIPNRVQCAVGLPDDYAYQGLDTPDVEDTLIRKKARGGNPGAYVPGVIYSEENPGDNEMHKSLNKFEAVKVAIGVEGGHPKDSVNCDCPRYYTPNKSLILDTEDLGLKTAEVDPAVELDPRWHFWHDEVFGASRNDGDRKNAMLNLHRPYLHEINTWYSRNKPTKLPESEIL